MSLPVLYSFRRCPYAIRARMAIVASELSVELREVFLKNKPDSMLRISPKATVPVLQLEDNVLEESLDIMQWALMQSDPLQLGLGDHESAELISLNDNEFKHWLDKYKYADRYPEMTAEEYRSRACEFLAKLEQQLHRYTYLAGDDLSFTDLAVFPFIRQFAYVDIEWFNNAEYRKLVQWLNLMLEHELFTSVMSKYDAWQEHTVGVEFPEKDNTSE